MTPKPLTPYLRRRQLLAALRDVQLRNRLDAAALRAGYRQARRLGRALAALAAETERS